MHIESLQTFLNVQFQLFGSLARKGTGHDVDLIVIGTEDQWVLFKKLVLEDLSQCKNLSPALIRYKALMGVFADKFKQSSYIFLPIDVFVFPPNWRERLPELQAAFPHEDPNFMENIAKDARPLSDFFA